MDVDGTVHSIGSYDTSHQSDLVDARRLVPHLHRVTPDHRWLATFLPSESRLELRPAGGQSADSPSMRRGISVRIDGLGSGFRTFRWLPDGTGLVIQTSRGLWLARLNPDAPPKQPVTAHRLIKGSGRLGSAAIVDFRTVGAGFIAHTSWSAGHGLANKLLYFEVPARGHQVVRHDLTPESGTLGAANVRSDGRIVVAIRRVPFHGATRDELWTYSTDEGGMPKPVGTRACENGCNISNWTPGTERLVYATTRGDIVIELPGRTPVRTKIVRVDEDRRWDRVHTLWTNPQEDWVLAATDRQLTVWDAEGTRLWSWKPSQSLIRTAHFLGDGRTVAVGTDAELLHLRSGGIGAPAQVSLRRSVALLVEPKGQPNPTRRLPGPVVVKNQAAAPFLDDVVPLANGATAFAVVTVHSGPGRHRRHRLIRGPLNDLSKAGAPRR